MSQTTLKKLKTFGISNLSGSVFYGSIKDVNRDSAALSHAHYMRRAFEVLRLDGILCFEGRPTVFLKNYSAPLLREEANKVQRQCWNQGTATVLVLQDPAHVYLYSASVKPSNDNDENRSHAALVDVLEKGADALEAYQLISGIASGQLYRERKDLFKPDQAVDRYLIDNLGAVCDELCPDRDPPNMRRVHAFLGQLIFTCYLIDREIIKLADYHFINSSKINVVKLVDLFEVYSTEKVKEVLYKLFRSLKYEFNGSMFDRDLDQERAEIRDKDIETLRHFLSGEAVGKQQLTLGFWAYDFSVIPVETISAIYENFLAREDLAGKSEKGAFYTPKNLAEMTVEEALAGESDLLNKRFLDPSCGSGIFLVVLFNRLAEELRFLHPRPTFKKKKERLVNLLRSNLRGVDVNETACRITCFSLYIALLDQFDPPTLRDLKARGDQHAKAKFLPKILSQDCGEKLSESEKTIFEGNFFDPELMDCNDFDFIIGNPPWVGRGKSKDACLEKWLFDKTKNPYLAEAKMSKAQMQETFFPQKQTSHAFMWKASVHAKMDGKIALVLPSEVLLNQTDAFQAAYFKQVTAERIVQLVDFRFFLFSGAIRPSFIGLFRNTSSAEAKQCIEYLVPKVMRQDSRPGLVTISSDDRKWLDLRDLQQACADRNAAMLWKNHLWGTSRDIKFLDYLNELPRLGDIAGEPDEGKRWVKGKGFQPWYDIAQKDNPKAYGSPKPIPKNLGDRFIKTVDDTFKLFLIQDDCISLEERLSSIRCKGRPDASDYDLKASAEHFRRCPGEELFMPPVVLINKGFSKFSYVDFPIFYQDAITGISGKDEDRDLLIFFTIYVGSKLSRYFQFHTAGSWGTERDQVHVHELMRLPFPLPESEDTHADAQNILEEVAEAVLSLKYEVAQEYAFEKKQNKAGKSLELRAESLAKTRSSKIEKLQKRLEPLIYKYFNLSDEEIALIEDTCEIYEPSSTPPTWQSDLQTLKPTSAAHRKTYAKTLSDTLNDWSKLDQPKGQKVPFYFAAEYGTFSQQGLTWVRLSRSQKKKAPIASEDESAGESFARLSRSSKAETGAFEYLRGIIFSDADFIYIVKPDLRGKWTRTAALNDADTLFEAIVSSRKK